MSGAAAEMQQATRGRHALIQGKARVSASRCRQPPASTAFARPGERLAVAKAAQRNDRGLGAVGNLANSGKQSVRIC
jgi:hypothetical protein